MQLVDEVVGERASLPEVRFHKPTITVRELLHARVDLEIEAAQRPLLEKLERSRLTVAQIAEAHCNAVEWRLNGAEKMLRPTLFRACEKGLLPDRAKLIETVEEAFTSNRFFVLLDDRQAEDLDQEVEIDRTGEALFLLLTPLQGG